MNRPRLCSATSKGRCAASGAREWCLWAQLLPHRHCERSDLFAEALAKAEAIQIAIAEAVWIASSQGLLAMTACGANARLSRVPDALQRSYAAAGPSRPQKALPHGPRLCSASSKGRCAASGARERCFGARGRAILNLSALTGSVASSPRNGEAVVAGGARRAMRTHRMPSREG